jgi:hypothetical protein
MMSEKYIIVTPCPHCDKPVSSWVYTDYINRLEKENAELKDDVERLKNVVDRHKSIIKGILQGFLDNGFSLSYKCLLDKFKQAESEGQK